MGGGWWWWGGHLKCKNGRDGRDGWKGVKGCAPGPPGHRGHPGPDGPKGPQGIKGENGTMGDASTVMGEVGPMGENGTNGNDGQMGSEGMKGDAGLPGVNGSQGIQGDKGPPGPQGFPGTSMSTTYTIWGRNTCPATENTTELYSGRMAAPQSNNAGGGGEYLCLPDTPSYGITTGTTGTSTIGGVMYETSGGPLANLNSGVVECAQCLIEGSSISTMFPGQIECPTVPASSWRLEYQGYLMAEPDTSTNTLAGTPTNFRASFVCIDSNSGSISAIGNNAALAHVIGDCSEQGLDCNTPGYEDNALISCVVCSYGP